MLGAISCVGDEFICKGLEEVLNGAIIGGDGEPRGPPKFVEENGPEWWPLLIKGSEPLKFPPKIGGGEEKDDVCGG